METAKWAKIGKRELQEGGKRKWVEREKWREARREREWKVAGREGRKKGGRRAIDQIR